MQVLSVQPDEYLYMYIPKEPAFRLRFRLSSCPRKFLCAHSQPTFRGNHYSNLGRHGLVLLVNFI